ncbi:MAG: hypothetical protein AAF399_07340 [Bacteroidota bacterium]
MKPLKSYVLAMGILIGLLSACQGDELRPAQIKSELQSSLWTKEKVILMTTDSMVIREILPTACEEKEQLSFEKGDRLLRSNHCKSREVEYECGQWEVTDRQLTAFLPTKRIVPDLCMNTNHESFWSYSGIAIDWKEERLILSGIPIDFFPEYLSTDTVALIEAGSLLASSFYSKTSGELSVPDGECCAE